MSRPRVPFCDFSNPPGFPSARQERPSPEHVRVIVRGRVRSSYGWTYTSADFWCPRHLVANAKGHLSGWRDVSVTLPATWNGEPLN